MKKCWKRECQNRPCDGVNHVDPFGNRFAETFSAVDPAELVTLDMTAEFHRVKDAAQFVELYLMHGTSYEHNVSRAGKTVTWQATMTADRAVPGYEGYLWSLCENAGYVGSTETQRPTVNGIRCPYEY